MKISFKDVECFKEILKERGLSQTQLASMIGVTQSYMNQVCMEKKNPSKKLSDKICFLLKIHFDDVFKMEYEVRPFEMGDTFNEFPLCFMPEVAKSIGLNESILIQFFLDWEGNYQSVNFNYFEGYHWVAITSEQLAKAFPFLSKDVTLDTLRSLIDKELIIAKDGMYRVNCDNLSSAYNG